MTPSSFDPRLRKRGDRVSLPEGGLEEACNRRGRTAIKEKRKVSRASASSKFLKVEQKTWSSFSSQHQESVHYLCCSYLGHSSYHLIVPLFAIIFINFENRRIINFTIAKKLNIFDLLKINLLENFFLNKKARLNVEKFKMNIINTIHFLFLILYNLICIYYISKIVLFSIDVRYICKFNFSRTIVLKVV